MPKQQRQSTSPFAVNMTCPHFAAEQHAAVSLLLGTRLLSINISCPHGTQQQTCHTLLLLLSNDGTDRWTDRQMD